MFKKYLKIYNAFLKIGVNRFLAYRADAFINVFVTTGVWVFFNVFSMYMVTAKTGGVFGWERGELILIACLYNIVIGVFGFLFVRSMSEFSELVNTGKFDLILLKPLDSQFYTSSHVTGLPSLIRSVLGVIIAIAVSISFGINVFFHNVIFFILASVSSLMLLYSLLFFLNTFTIWVPKIDNINELFYTLRAMGRFPRETFRQLSEIIYVFASPFVIVLSTPTRVLLGKATAYEVMELVSLTVLTMVIARLFWQFALRFYTSASS